MNSKIIREKVCAAILQVSEPFTAIDVANVLDGISQVQCSKPLLQLRASGFLSLEGKRGKAHLYKRTAKFAAEPGTVLSPIEIAWRELRATMVVEVPTLLLGLREDHR